MANSVELQRKWALAGAEARLKEVQAEVAEIYRVFPELRGRSAPGRAASESAPRKRRFSPKGREAISEGMRKYWALRKAKAKAAKAAKA